MTEKQNKPQPEPKKTKKVRLGCPGDGNDFCWCIGICDILEDVPLDDPRQEVTDYD